VIAILLITIWPFLDRKEDQDRAALRRRAIISIVIVLMIIALTIWGEVS